MQGIVPYNDTLDKVVGYGFRPTDEELVDHYLKHKLQGDDPRVDVMPEIDLCDVEPWEVPVMLEDSKIRFNDPEWFFFSRVDYKYLNSKRVNRTTKCGYWKTTGKERDVKNTDTNTVIGTKKTLVFYKGRVPDGVKSNWVIHEYHDATFHENQRTFVLCRLIKKPEKINEGGTDALICDEGGPKKGVVSDYANQEGTFTEIGTNFQEVHLPDNCFSPVQQSPIGIGIGPEEAFFPNSPLCNAYFENENNVMQTPLRITQDDKFVTQIPLRITQDDKVVMQIPLRIMQDDKVVTQIPLQITQDNNIQAPFATTADEEFLNSIIANQDSIMHEESMYTFVNNSTQSELLRRVYNESNDTNAEVISKLDGDIMDTSTMCNEYPNSNGYHASKKYKSSYNVVHGDACLLSSNHEASQEENESIFQDDFSVVVKSSCDSTPNKPFGDQLY